MTYPQRCKSTPLSERVARARWKMLGHILRSSSNSPAQLALFFNVESNSSMRGRVGRHQTNLFNIISNDLTDRNLSIVNTDELI